MPRDPDGYREYMRAYMLRRYHERRQAAIEHLGGECVKCGSTDQLEIDHVNPLTKGFTLSKLWSCAERKFWEEIEKCQILCHNCHAAKNRVDLSNLGHLRWQREKNSGV